MNGAISRLLFGEGLAVVGHTKVRGRSSLKLTLNNPCTYPAQIAELLKIIVEFGEAASPLKITAVGLISAGIILLHKY